MSELMICSRVKECELGCRKKGLFGPELNCGPHCVPHKRIEGCSVDCKATKAGYAGAGPCVAVGS